jgi:WD40 repeat protein
MVLWDIRSGRSELMEVAAKSTINSYDRRPKIAKAHNCCISSIRCSKDGRYVVSMANDKMAHVWDATSMQLERAANVSLILIK